MKTTLDAPGSAIQLQQSVLRGISRSFGDPDRARREVANVRDHYQEHLGPIYHRRMLGRKPGSGRCRGLHGRHADASRLAARGERVAGPCGLDTRTRRPVHHDLSKLCGPASRRRPTVHCGPGRRRSDSHLLPRVPGRPCPRSRHRACSFGARVAAHSQQLRQASTRPRLARNGIGTPRTEDHHRPSGSRHGNVGRPFTGFIAPGLEHAFVNPNQGSQSK